MSQRQASDRFQGHRRKAFGSARTTCQQPAILKMLLALADEDAAAGAEKGKQLEELSLGVACGHRNVYRQREIFFL